MKRSRLIDPCPECGALYHTPTDTCAQRFHTLLALDHSQREPWGSRHGLAFAAFTLQHAGRYPRDILQRSWPLLTSVYLSGVPVAKVVRGLRRSGKAQPDWDVPDLPTRRSPAGFAVTIADLGAFAAESYPSQLDAWCRATLAGWQAPSAA
jgi:hypothetical protein